jgi:hypothetical protein
MAVAVGDQRRRKEAMELLVNEISKGDEDGIINSLRSAIEVVRYDYKLMLNTNNLITSIFN